MNRIFCILICVEIGLTAFPVRAVEPGGPVPPSFLSSNAPRDITEIYLRFHEKELCGDVSALFVYDGSGLQVWSRARDGGSYGKLMKLIKPLFADYPVETYSSTLYPDKGAGSDEPLPPSLWENSELSDYLLAPLIETPLIDASDMPMFIGTPADLYRRRLRMFSEEVLASGSELERIAAELSELTRMGTDRALDPKLESLAARISMDHCRDMEKLAEKLQKSLERALPGDARTIDADSARPDPDETCSIRDLADRIYESSREIFQGVRSFLYPEHHTVQLEELRRPGILVSLEELRELQKEYLKRMSQDSDGN